MCSVIEFEYFRCITYKHWANKNVDLLTNVVVATLTYFTPQNDKMLSDNEGELNYTS